MIKDFINKIKPHFMTRNGWKRLFHSTMRLTCRNGIFRKYLKTHTSPKLQIASGENFLNGWLNTDISPWQGVPLNATKKFPFKDCTFDYIFNEHFIEHLTYAQGKYFLTECYRVLKPGGKIRISTPDLAFLLALERNKKNALHSKYIIWSAQKYGLKSASATSVINNFFQNWGHQFIYDYDALRHLLEQIGFNNVTRTQVGESTDIQLKNLESHGKYITDEFNKLESMVIEASKPN